MFQLPPKHCSGEVRVWRFCLPASDNTPFRPSNERLIGELGRIQCEVQQNDLDSAQRERCISETLLLLAELQVDQSLQRQCVKIPGIDGFLHAIDSVLFDDLGSDLLYGSSEAVLTHPSVSLLMAKKLGLAKASDTRFASDEDMLETFEVKEDLTTRINTVLQDYDISLASNEWVANAADAGATAVNFVIDEAQFNGSKCISPRLGELQQVPALLVHNTGVFLEQDFKGLSNIGIGGKGDNPDAIGRFGLGAFSFYHFTDVSRNLPLAYCPVRLT